MTSRKKRNRCSWVGEDPLYIEYHDKEWGVVTHKDRDHFEFLTLESAQAGLSWITILRKRENYRKAFANFDPEKVSRFTEKRVQKLMQNEGIVRNELKIRAAINNAQRFLELVETEGSFHDYLVSFYGGKTKLNKFKKITQVPASTPESTAIAKDLKSRGFKFLGPTTIYSHLQAAGIVNDHTTDCFRYKQLI